MARTIEILQYFTVKSDRNKHMCLLCPTYIIKGILEIGYGMINHESNTKVYKLDLYLHNLSKFCSIFSIETRLRDKNRNLIENVA